MLTKSEKLLKKIGQKVTCDYCRKRKTFDRNWMMTIKDKLIVCPKCKRVLLAQGIALVSL